MSELTVGDQVKLKPGIKGFGDQGYGNVRKATIHYFLSDVDGGVRLHEALGGARYWNVADLELVAHGLETSRVVAQKSP